MTLMTPMDEKFPIERQLAVEAAPIVLITLFTLEAADEARVLEAWIDDAELQFVLDTGEVFPGSCNAGVGREIAARIDGRDRGKKTPGNARNRENCSCRVERAV